MSAAGFFTGMLGEIGDSITQRKEREHKEELDQLNKEIGFYKDILPYASPDHVQYITQKMEDLISGGIKGNRAGGGKGKKQGGAKGMLSGVVQGLQYAMGGGQQPQTKPMEPLPAGTIITPEQQLQQKLREEEALQGPGSPRARAKIAEEQARPQAERAPREISKGPLTASELIQGAGGPVTTLFGEPITKDTPGHFSLHEINGKFVAVPERGPENVSEENLARLLQDSGEAASPEEAKKKAAAMLVSAEKEKGKKKPIRVGNQLVDPDTMKPVYTAPEKAGVPGGFEEIPGNTPEEKMANLPSNVKGMVKGLLNYKLPFPGAFALNNPKSPWNAAANAAMQIDPTWSAGEYQSRVKLLNDFKSGKAAANVRSLNTLIHHMDRLSKSAASLKNTDYETINEITNWLGRKTGTKSPRLNRFSDDVNATAEEAATLFKGTSGTDQEAKAWKAGISAADSPEAMQAHVDEVLNLALGRLEFLNSQYESGMGRPKDFNFLAPTARDILTRMKVPLDNYRESPRESGGAVTIPERPAELGPPPSTGGAASAPSGATHAVIVNGKVVGYTSDGKTMTPASQ